MKVCSVIFSFLSLFVFIKESEAQKILPVQNNQKPDSILRETLDPTSGQYYASYKTINTYDSFGRLEIAASTDYVGNRYKSVYSYNRDGIAYMIINYQWDSYQSKWNFFEKREYEHDAAGNIKLWIFSTWEPTSKKWVYFRKEETSRDANGQEILNIIYFWDVSSNLWRVVDRRESAYDNNGDKTLNADYYQYETGGGLIGSLKIEYTYYEKGKISSVSDFSWLNNKWVISYKSDNTYDSNGNLILSVIYRRDQNSNQLIPDYKTEQIYNDKGKIIANNNFFWDTGGNQWIGNSRSEFTYDSNGNNILAIYYQIDTLTGQLGFDHKYEYSYNTAGDQILSIDYFWDKSSALWVGNRKTETQKSQIAAGMNTISINYLWNKEQNHWDYTYKYDLTTDDNQFYDDWIYSWDIVNGDWFLIARDLYKAEGFTIFQSWSEWDLATHHIQDGWNQSTYLSEHLTLSEMPENKINVYPNPASDKIVFFVNDINKTARIELFDNEGQKVMDQKFPVTGQISVNRLASGLYIYVIHNNEKIYKGKIVVGK
jgi:hypothetical protein